MTSAPLSLTSEQRAQLDEIDALARSGEAGLATLVERLKTPSWAVRRAVVSALARAGDEAVGPLCGFLRQRREDENAIAAAVDALSAVRAERADASVGELLEGEPPPVVCDALQILGRRGSRAQVPAIARLTTDADDNVALAALEALSRIGGPDTIAPLSAAAESGNFFRVFPAIDALGRSGDPRAIKPLLSLLESPMYARDVVKALGRSGQPRAIAPLVRLLSHAADAMVREAAIALCDLHDAMRERFGTASQLEETLRSSPDTSSLSRRITRCVHGASTVEQASLGRVLGWVGGEGAAGCLLSLLDDPDPHVARAASGALRRLGPSAHPALLEALRDGSSERRLALLPLVSKARASVADVALCLDDPDPQVRAAACDLLARIGSAEAARPLFSKLPDPDPRVRHAAASALQALGTGETLTLALEGARSSEPRVRREALKMVGFFGLKEGLPALLEAIAGDDEASRDAAISALPMLDDEGALEALLSASRRVDEKARASAMRALAHAPPGDRYRDALLAGLRDGHPWVRYYACQSLGRRGEGREPSVTRAIVGLLGDPAPQVTIAAVEALARLGGPEALTALREAASSDSADIARAALVGLGGSGDRESLPTLLEAARSAEPATRLVALEGVASFDAPEVVPSLVAGCSDPDEGVRGAALSALAARAGVESGRALISLLSSEATRERALDSLALPVEGRLEAVSGALASAGDDLARLLTGALVRAGRPEAIEALAAALFGEALPAALAAADSLAAVGSLEAREALEHGARSHPDARVRERCSLSLSDR